MVHTNRRNAGSVSTVLKPWCTICTSCCTSLGKGSPIPSAAVLDVSTMQSTPQNGALGGYDRQNRKKGSKVHAAVDTLGLLLLALKITDVNEQERVANGTIWSNRFRKRRESVLKMATLI